MPRSNTKFVTLTLSGWRAGIGPDGNPADHLTPLMVAGDPNADPPDSPDARIDPNLPTSAYTGVGSLLVNDTYISTGVAISPYHVLTTAHSLDLEGDDGEIDVFPEAVILTFNIDGDQSLQIAASDLAIYPDYTGFDSSFQNDLAIITLSEPLPDSVTIYPIYTEPLPAQTIITMVGYGTTGDGVQGQIPGSASLDTKRVGQNQVEDLSRLASRVAWSDEIFLFDFDAPDGSTNTLKRLGSGSGLGNDVETTLGPGDSGSPSFVTIDGVTYLAGINTFSIDSRRFSNPETGSPGLFGSVAGGVLLSDPDKLAWINSFLDPLSQPGSLSGNLWVDQNQDGQQSADEPGLGGWLVFLDNNQNGVADADEPQTQTDSNGTYLFTDLPTGTYEVAVEPQPNWVQTFPTSGDVVVLAADFSNDQGDPSLDGFTIDNTGAAVTGLWHLSTGRGSQDGHSADDSLYFGTGETATGGGTYDVGDTAGQVLSPILDLRGLTTADLSFNYFLEVEPSLLGDRVSVAVSQNGGEFETIATKSDELVVALDSDAWMTLVVDLTPYVGSEIQLQFGFDTGDSFANNFEGWYIDDVVVQGTTSSIQTVAVEPGSSADQINFGFTPVDGGSLQESANLAWI